MQQRTQLKPVTAMTAFTPVRSGLLQRKCACGGTPGPTGECDECRKKKLQRKATKSEFGTRNDSSVPPIVHEVLRSPGQPLDAQTRAFMEPRFGHDFSEVRVHTDAKATASARAVGALAYTVGKDVVFGAGQYAPRASEGRRLMAHELTHVMQQSTGGGSLQAQSLNREVPDKFEREAERVSWLVTAPSADSVAPLTVGKSPIGVMRAPDEAATKKCLEDCETRFNNCLDHTRFPPECLARRGVCLASCEPAAKPAPPKDKADETPKPIRIEDITIESGGKKEKIDPSKVTSGIWWLNGVTPTLSPLYPTEKNINTGLTPAGDFQYQVTKGADKLALLNGGAETSKLTLKDSSTVRVRGIGPSKAVKDVTIQITHTPPKSKTSSVYTADLEVRAPNRLDGLNCTHVAKGAEGYTSIFRATVRDNFGAAMPYIDYNEDFDAGSLGPGVTGEWGPAFAARAKGSSITLGSAALEDHYEADISGGSAPPGMTPSPSNPKTPLGSALVGSFPHRWYIGTKTTGKGVQVSAHVGKLFSDHGAYTDFVSPLSPKGPPDECPKTKTPAKTP